MQRRMEVPEVCRVCLARSRALYRLADTPLEETYKRVTRGTLRVDGLPCCVCGMCLSALRRCRRFVEAAHRANIALGRWRRSPRAKVKLTESPIFSLTQSVPEVFDLMSSSPEPPVKQETDSVGSKYGEMLHQVQNVGAYHDKDNFFSEEIKYEVTDDFGDDQNGNTRGSDDEIDNRQRLNNTIFFESGDSDITHCSDGDDVSNSQLPGNSECVGLHKEEIGVFKDVKFNLEVLHNINYEPGLGTSHGKRESDVDTPASSHIQMGKQIKVTEDKRAVYRIGNLCRSSEYKTPFLCNKCDYKCSLRKTLKQHLLTHTGEKLLSCDKCEYKCSQRQSLKLHSMTHTGEKPFWCEKCEYKSNYKQCLKQHLLTHTDKKPFSCDKCEYKGRQKTHLLVHLLTHTDEKPFSCDMCEYKFYSKVNLKNHLLTHTGEKPFSCNKCKFKCNRKNNLKQHLLTHASEKPLSCDRCEYKCIDKKSLKNHLFSHTGEKPFSCDKCEYKCVHKGNLKQHLLSHTGEKTFLCHICNQRFKHRQHLKPHLRTHSGEKPFSCDKCEYKCIEKKSLKRHLLIHTGEKPFSCDKCEYKFRQKYHLKKHLLTHIKL